MYDTEPDMTRMPSRSYCEQCITSLTLNQWSSSGNPVCLELRPQCTLESHWRNASELPVAFQWSSSVFQLCKLTLDRHWVQASASVVPVASQCTCGSSGLPVCSNYANKHWIATGIPLGASISHCGSSGTPVYLWLQWSSSAVCPVVSQCTDRIWFGGHWVRPLPSMRQLMYSTAMARVVWAKLI